MVCLVLLFVHLQIESNIFLRGKNAVEIGMVIICLKILG